MTTDSVERGAVVLGTAGHIDHGKTALIRALTGQDTDRLKEERERGISIDLGFAYYEAFGKVFGVVDVPGHERFIRNMLAGAHGIDLVLFTVAADDGIMPQTEEHFDILHLLGVRRAVFVITKADLVDAGRIAEVRSDIEVLVCDTAFESSPVCPVSSLTGAGMDELRREIARQLEDLPPREANGYFRLPVDRAFAMHGHGLVVTGTAVSGTLREGDPLVLRPGDVETRARSIQVHGRSVKEARAGQRVAVNLAGVERTQARRGSVLVDPHVEFTSDRFDCWFEARPAARRPIKSFDRVRVYLMTAEVMGHVIVLGDRRELPPKSRAFCQIVLEDDAVLTAGDRFIVRTEAATRTTGGGVIVHPFASRHRVADAGLEEKLATLRDEPLPRRMHAFLELLHEFAAPTEYVAQGLNRTPAEIRSAAAGSQQLIALPGEADAQAFTTREKWDKLARLVVDALSQFHRNHPLEPGMDVESLRSRLRVPVPPRLFRPVVARLEAEKLVAREESSLRLIDHRVIFDRKEEQVAARVRDAIVAGGFTPPDVKQLEAQLELAGPQLAQILKVLEKSGAISRVSTDLYYDASALEKARRLLIDFLRDHAEITVGDFRNLLAASRKYALALLEGFDRAALTVRVGDARRLRR